MIVGVPAAKVEVLRAATPFVRATVPRVFVPFLKVTFPVGVPFEELTVAVNVTESPKLDGFGFDTNAVVVGTAFTVCTRMTDVLAA